MAKKPQVEGLEELIERCAGIVVGRPPVHPFDSMATWVTSRPPQASRPAPTGRASWCRKLSISLHRRPCRSGTLAHTTTSAWPTSSRFPTPGQLASWAGMCPGQRESAGKRGSAKTRKGSKWLRTTLWSRVGSAGCRAQGELPVRAPSPGLPTPRGQEGRRRRRTGDPHRCPSGAIDRPALRRPGSRDLRNLSASHVSASWLSQLRALGYGVRVHQPGA